MTHPRTPITAARATAPAAPAATAARRIATAVLALAAAASAQAWSAQPTAVSFANASGLMLSGQVFTPTGAAPAVGRPAVVMLHGCAGLYYTNAQGQVSISSIYREWADRLTAAGYVALLVDSFGPRNAGNQCGNGAGTGVSEIFDRPADALAGRNFLAAGGYGVNAARIGLLGWSHGASTVLSTLATRKPVEYTVDNPLAAGAPFRVGVAFYPGGGLSDSRCYQKRNDGSTTTSCWNGIALSVWDSYTPLAIHHGTADTTTLLSYVSTRVTRAQASAGGASVALTTYTDAVHSFDDPNTGGGACVSAASTPNPCAKLAGDTAAMATFATWLGN